MSGSTHLTLPTQVALTDPRGRAKFSLITRVKFTQWAAFAPKIIAESALVGGVRDTARFMLNRFSCKPNCVSLGIREQNPTDSVQRFGIV